MCVCIYIYTYIYICIPHDGGADNCALGNSSGEVRQPVSVVPLYAVSSLHGLLAEESCRTGGRRLQKPSCASLISPEDMKPT